MANNKTTIDDDDDWDGAIVNPKFGMWMRTNRRRCDLNRKNERQRSRTFQYTCVSMKQMLKNLIL